MCDLFTLFVVVVYSSSLRQQLQDSGKKLVGAHHYNKEGAVTSRQVCCPTLPYFLIFHEFVDEKRYRECTLSLMVCI